MIEFSLILSAYLRGSKNKQKSYPLDYKLRIIEEAKLSGSNKGTAREHGINEKQVRTWRKDEAKIRLALSEGRMFRIEGGGRKTQGKL